VPTVTSLGPFYERRVPCTRLVAIRQQPLEVTQEFLNEYRHRFSAKWWRIEGDNPEPVTTDLGEDGLPDEGWTRKDITAWLKDNGATVGKYATKATLLGMVENVLNPEPAPEPVPEPEEPATVAEEPAEAQPEPTTGDEQ
jgi:hypothetical protein